MGVLAGLLFNFKSNLSPTPIPLPLIHISCASNWPPNHQQAVRTCTILHKRISNDGKQLSVHKRECPSILPFVALTHSFQVKWFRVGFWLRLPDQLQEAWWRVLPFVWRCKDGCFGPSVVPAVMHNKHIYNLPPLFTSDIHSTPMAQEEDQKHTDTSIQQYCSSIEYFVNMNVVKDMCFCLI